MGKQVFQSKYDLWCVHGKHPVFGTINIFDLEYDHAEQFYDDLINLGFTEHNLFLATQKHQTYSVVGDHPVLKRPDRFGLTIGEAIQWKDILLSMEYENVDIIPQKVK